MTTQDIGRPYQGKILAEEDLQALARQMKARAGLTNKQLAKLLGKYPSYISLTLRSRTMQPGHVETCLNIIETLSDTRLDGPWYRPI